ncbi:TVP38/TMEM64 family protein [Microbulbifer sp. OS29]|uniref:TVP38/TMEM64 family membrane protein n=1 Tax=Microbulbifer okhotskensis TaxID=2926617 RepID=A0A9X2EMF9_9GAMM|nr:TVP38/TMEM64 family protein [Microbulbifer okhotskensis]MCO1334374.1 TVP38/TMEM64 family protein [Microbulbifer okhotskensis]
MNKKILLVAVIVVLVITFYGLDFHHWLSLDKLKVGAKGFQQWQSTSPLLVGLLFFVFYVVVTGLSLPGAAILTIAAGALFGLFWGTVIVSFASSVGATLAFLMARYLFRDSVQGRFSERLQVINTGIEREGAFYLFALRLVPAFPFFLINVLMGLTHIKVWTFYWVSQLGMLAGTVVYVNAGTQLARVENLKDILSLPLLLSFILLGIFPLIAKYALSWFKRRRQAG